MVRKKSATSPGAKQRPLPNLVVGNHSSTNRVAQGLPYYLKFVETFPTVQALASGKKYCVCGKVSILHPGAQSSQGAQEVVARYNGIFPATLMNSNFTRHWRLHGAKAIASISFGQPVAVVDGNVFRVLARIFGIETPINTPEGKEYFF